MIKALPKYLLILCIFLLSGHSFLSAHATQARIRYSSIKIPVSSAQANPDLVQNDPASALFISSGNQKENHDLDVLVLCDDNDNDDDELISFKKRSGSDDGSTSVFFTQLAGYFSGPGKNMPSSFSYFSNTPTDRYLLFQTFRI